MYAGPPPSGANRIARKHRQASDDVQDEASTSSAVTRASLSGIRTTRKRVGESVIPALLRSHMIHTSQNTLTHPRSDRRADTVFKKMSKLSPLPNLKPLSFSILFEDFVQVLCVGAGTCASGLTVWEVSEVPELGLMWQHMERSTVRLLGLQLQEVRGRKSTKHPEWKPFSPTQLP